MNKALLAVLVLAFFACNTRNKKSVYHGKLEELHIGDFILAKDSLTNSFFNIRVIRDMNQEYLLTTSEAKDFEGYAFVFRNPSSGEEIKRVEIPSEGPESLGAGIVGNFVSTSDQIFMINYLFKIGEYGKDGKKKREHSAFKEYFEKESPLALSIGKNNMHGSGSNLQLWFTSLSNYPI